MDYWYSRSTGGFTPAKRKGKPKDAVLVTAAEHAALFPKDQPQREIEAGPDGRPRCKNHGLADRRRDLLFAIKAEAARRIAAVVPLHKQLNALREGSDPGWARIDAIRDASNAIEASYIDFDGGALAEISKHPLWPEFD